MNTLPLSSAYELQSMLESSGHAEKVMDEIAEISKAPDVSEAVQVLKHISGMLGCKSAAFASFLQDDPWHQSYRFLLACHPAWCASYQSLAWFADDPWLAYARTNVLPARDDEIQVRTPKQQEIVELARRFDVVSALIVPAPSPGSLSRLGVLMLGSSEPGFFLKVDSKKLRLLARALASELHDWYTARLASELIETAKLTELDLDLLRHERAGLSSKEIERLIGSSAHAIDSRFQRILSRLKVQSRRSAAQMAAEYGLI